MRGGNISTEKLNIKNYRSFQKSEEKEEEKESENKKGSMDLVNPDIINNNIKILPTVKNNEQPKIINKKVELGYNHVNSLNNININLKKKKRNKKAKFSSFRKSKINIK
jgi:hypothetical protein